MSELSLQRISAFNQELAALAATGLPLDIGIDGPAKTIADKIQRIDSALVARVSRGQNIEQAIAEETELPARYRTALWTWIHVDDPAVALNLIASPAEARRQFGRNLGQTMVYPLIVLSLTYVAFFYLCAVTAPTIEGIYAQLWQAPSDSLAFLIASRNLMPIWGPLIPLLFVVVLFWWRMRASRMTWKWVPGSARYFRAMQNAHLAGQLAALLESGCSLQTSLSRMVGSPEHGGSVHDAAAQRSDGSIVESFPPLLRWAVQGDLGGEPMPRVLRFVAQTYRQTAERQKRVWRVIAPTILGVILGGTFVLAYGVGLFLPVVQLLKDVSLPGGP